jgi:nitrogen regulatory protein P-II 1
VIAGCDERADAGAEAAAPGATRENDRGQIFAICLRRLSGFRWRIGSMKKIEAFIRHEAFDPIRAELLDKGLPSMSILEVKGSGRQKGEVEHYRGSVLMISVRPKLKLEVVVEDKDKDAVVEAILRHARTGEVGDGKIFVLPVEEAIRIRTGEDGEAVLQAHEPSV